ncbi:heat shock [Chamberlinius hualienensis]
MSVVGIDFGSESCYIAVAKSGGIETIANDYSLRATPTCVAFGEKSRVLGVAAKNQQITNMKNTVYGFRQLLGKKYNHPGLKAEFDKLPYKILRLPNDDIGIEVQYLNKKVIFSPEQICGMMFTKLKETVEATLKSKVTDCVISVPAHFKDAERRALLSAAQVAELNVLRLMNDTTAAALCYGIYKQDLPAAEEKARHVVFVDMGYSTLQVSAVGFQKGKLKVLATISDPTLGARSIDERLAQHFNEGFKTRFKVDGNTNQRAYVRLLHEVERVKKQMSANSTILPLAIECFIDEIDVNARMKRTEMEELISDFLERIEVVFRQLLQDCRLNPDDISSVELLGGSTRIPAIKNLILEVFKKEPSTTLNQDESVAKGCALQCAMLSPSYKVRDFAVTDVQLYPIRLLWGEQDEDGSDIVFTKYHPVPFSKQLTFYRKNPFKLEAHYDNIPESDSLIGKFIINNVSSNAEGGSSKVKVKVRINIHGLFTVSSAVLLEPKDNSNKSAEEPMQVDQNSATKASENDADKMDAENQSNEKSVPSDHEPNKSEQQTNSTNNPDEKKDSTDKKESPTNKKAKMVVRQVDLPIDKVVHETSQQQLNLYIEEEGRMVAADKLEKERVDAKNAVEEYVYDMREKINDALAPYVLEKEREAFTALLNDTENWLYEDGMDEVKNSYIVKLEELRKYGEPVKHRQQEFEMRPKALEDFGRSIQLTRKALDSFAQREETYIHIEPAKMNEIKSAVEDAQRRYDEAAKPCEFHENLPVSVDDIKRAKQGLESIVNPILNTPKPKAEPPQDQPANNGATADGQSKGQSDGSSESKMDCETNN